MADLVYHNIHALAYTGIVDLTVDNLFVALLDATYVPNPDHTVWADVAASELGAGGGYAAGGVAVVGTVTDIDASNQVQVDITNPAWLATPGGIGPFGYGVLYDGTPVGDPLIYLFDFGALQTAAPGATITINIDPNGLFLVG
jgi:hypothetical protein